LDFAGKNDYAYETAAADNRTFVTGQVTDAAGNADWLVRAYDAGTGALLWQDHLDYAGKADLALGIGVDGATVFASGYVTTAANNRNFFVRAYDVATGAVRWQDEFDLAGKSDEAGPLAVNGGGLFVTGRVTNAQGGTDWLVRAYDAGSGTLRWQDLFNAGGFDHVVSVSAAGSRVYTAGVLSDSTGRRSFAVRANDAESGKLVWQDEVVGGFIFDVAWQVVSDGPRVFAAGFSQGSGEKLDFLVRAYDSGSGSLLWEDRVNEGGGFDGASAVAVKDGIVVVGGAGGPLCRWDKASNCDWLVRAYAARTGALQWQAQVDGVGKDDQVNGVTLADNQAFVAGVLTNSRNDFDFLLRTYDLRSGVSNWQDQVSNAWAEQVALGDHEVFVVGHADVGPNNSDWLVRAYTAESGGNAPAVTDSVLRNASVSDPEALPGKTGIPASPWRPVVTDESGVEIVDLTRLDSPRRRSLVSRFSLLEDFFSL
jgi:hypothetical protein